MASIRKIIGAHGVSYKFTASKGTTADGKQRRCYMTWQVPPGMSSLQAKKEAQKLAIQFEESIDKGYVVNDRQTFAEYAEYVLALKKSTGVKPKTIDSYRFLLKRIIPAIGHLKLAEIRPQHLNELYMALSKPGARTTATRAVAKKDIAAILRQRGLTRQDVAAQAGIGINTVDVIRNGNPVRLDSAEKLAAALGEKVDALFTVRRDTSPMEPKTILEYHRCVHAILAQAEKEMLVPYNAASKATPPKARRKEVNYFQPDEVADILDALEEEPLKWRMYTHMLIVTGARRGEVIAIKWSNIDLDAAMLRIDSEILYSKEMGVYEAPTKTSDVRFLKLPAETIALLKEYRVWYEDLKAQNGDRWNDSGYVFVRMDGRPLHPDTPTGWLNSFAARHDLRHINPHAFRHTVASVLINDGQDIVTVSHRLGHSRVSTTTDIYSHLIAGADASACDSIADALLRRRDRKAGSA